MWQRRCGYCPATAGTLGTAAAMAELGNPGLEGGGSGMQGTTAGGLLAQGTVALGCRARKGGGRMWNGLLANPSLV